MELAQKRPRIDIPSSTAEKMTEYASLLGIVFILWTLFSYWSGLPDEIPIHYGLTGDPDSYGAKATLFILPLITVILYAGFTILRKYPHVYNYPVEITQENAGIQYSLALKLIGLLKVEIVWLFAYIHWRTCLIGMGEASSLGIWFLPVFVALILLTAILYVIKARKAA